MRRTTCAGGASVIMWLNRTEWQRRNGVLIIDSRSSGWLSHQPVTIALLSLLSYVLVLALSTGIAHAYPSDLQIRNEIRRDVTSSTHRLVMYIQTFHDEDNSSTPLSLLPLLNEDTGITHVILAMLHLNTDPGDIHLNNNPPNASMFDSVWSDVATLQANGIKVMATIGGAGDGSFGHLADDFEAYYEPLVNNVLKPYNLDGLDLDIEESTDISVPLQLLNALYNDMGSDFLLAMAPVASALQSSTGGDLSGFSYFDLDSQAVVNGTSTPLVSWYNAQFYSGFGSPSTTSTYDSRISAGWDASRVVMGVLDSASDGSGEVGLANLEVTIASLVAEYPTFGGVDGWEYFNAGNDDGDSDPAAWVKSIGDALSGSSSNTTRRVKRAARSLPLPPAPFASLAIETVENAGATHFEAVRALNRTQGNVGAAVELYTDYRIQ